MLEQAPRTRRGTTHRLNTLQALIDALSTLPLEELLPELAVRPASMHEAERAEVRRHGEQLVSACGRVGESDPSG